MLLATATISAHAVTTIAAWTFETSIPTTAGPLSPEVGSGAGTAVGLGGFSNPGGNGSAESWSATSWSIGDYWQFQVSTLGHENISLSWDQTSSATGPRDFGLFWSTDGSAFTQFGANYAVLVNGVPNPAWSAGSFQSAYTFNADLSPIVALDNDGSVFFRLVLQTDTQADGVGTVTTSGTDRIDNFTVNATKIPPTGVPETLPFGFVAAALLGVLAWGHQLRKIPFKV